VGYGAGPTDAAASSEPETRGGFLENDLEALISLLRQRRKILGDTMRSSHEYWNGIHHVLELRAALAQAEGRFRELYDFIPTPFLVLDSAMRIRSANAAAVQLLGPGSSAVGTSLKALLSAREQNDVAGILFTGDAPRPFEVQLRTTKGWRAVQMTALAVDESAIDASVTARGRSYYVVLIDITDIRRLEDERQALDRARTQSQEAERAAREADRAKDEFLAMLSHELRTPLTPVLAAVGAIDSEPVPAAAREAIAIIRRNVHAEARLIDDLLDVARIRQGRLGLDRRPFSLHDLLAHVVVDWQPEAARRGLTLELARDARDDVVHADRERIAQVFRNVLGNATKFTDPGGRVTVRTSDDHGRIRVTVTDTGSGIGRDDLDRLFLTFAGARPVAQGRSGLGLGLAISRGILEAHGGRIRVQSPGAGRGTEVEIELDLTEEAAEVVATPARPRDPAPAPATPAPRDGGRPRVLLVEDHEDSAATLAMVLSIRGYDVRVARTLAQARGMAEDCDVLISDISLPDGTGLDLLREVRRHRDVKAIAVSGYGTEEDRRRSADAGFAEHLIKPFDPDRLIDTISRLTDAR
jgi:signal transduction histidine kinase